MIDNVCPMGKWEFNKSVTDCFDNMLQRSIPQYDIMRDAVYNLGCKILNEHKNKNILDIGCSNGLALVPFVNKYNVDAKFKGLDISETMLEEAEKRFKNYIKNNIVSIQNLDLRNSFPHDVYSLIMSVLTIQFIPIEYRQNIIQNIYDNLNDGGCFIMVEKVLGSCSIINNIMVDEYIYLKEKNGYSKEQIERKKLSLEGILVPMTSNWNLDLLKQAGFKKIDVFWRWMNFEGYICIK